MLYLIGSIPREEVLPKRKPVRKWIQNPKTLEEFLPVFPKETSCFHTNRVSQKLINLLFEFNQSLQANESTLENIKQLKDSYLLLTGQQPTLLTGPLYTVYKIIHTIKLADVLSNRFNHKFIPLFWNASEDHGFTKVNHTYLINEGKLQLLKLNAPKINEQLPFSQINLKDTKIKQFIKELSLSKEVLSLIETTLQLSTTFSDWILNILMKLFTKYGLVIIDPEKLNLKSLSVEVFQYEIESPLVTTKLVIEAGERLEKQGYKPQVHKRHNQCNFLLKINNIRYPVIYEKGRFKLEGKEYTKEELLFLLKNSPNSFTTGVILRPILADYLLGNTIHVVGPSELSYYAQLKNIYKIYNLPMPYLILRTSATLIEEPQIEKLKKYNLNLREIFKKDKEQLMRLKGIKKEEIEYLKNSLYPNQTLQERIICVFQFLSKYGMEFLNLLYEKLPIDYTKHYILEIKGN